MRLPVLIISLSFIAGCSFGNSNAENKIVAQINKYKMTTEDLKYEFKNVSYDEIERIKTENGIRQYLESFIEKEVLLQEAQRQGVDKEKAFMKSIEKYWEQALLKTLLERKSREISGIIHVYDSEIEDYCRDFGEGASLSKVKNEIRNIIKKKKEEDAMNAWINELKNKSYIKINENAAKDAFK